MPQNDDRTYRPFNDFDKAQAVNYIQNVLRQGLTQQEAVMRAGAKFNWHNDDLLAGYNFARQAQRANDAAEQLGRRGPGGGPPISIPNVPTVGTGVGMVIHDVLVTVTDPDTGQTFTFRGELVNPTPMSASDIREYYASDLAALLRLRSSPNVRGGQLPDDPTIDVLILDVGKGVASNAV